MLLGCGLMIVILAVFGERLSSGWLFALVIGACVVPHLFMMRGHRGHETHMTPTAEPETTDEKKKHQGGSCCH